MGCHRKGTFSYLIFTRYAFEAMLFTGENFHEVSPGGGGNDRKVQALHAVRYTLGFKANADDPGVPFEALLGALVFAAGAMLLFTLFFTWRSREGN